MAMDINAGIAMITTMGIAMGMAMGMAMGIATGIVTSIITGRAAASLNMQMG